MMQRLQITTTTTTTMIMMIIMSPTLSSLSFTPSSSHYCREGTSLSMISNANRYNDLDNDNNHHNIMNTAVSSTLASDLLYEEQEKLIVKRGIFEESLVTNVTPLLAPSIKIRGVGKAGGFGGGGGGSSKTTTHKPHHDNKKKSSSNNFQAEGNVYANILRSEGLVRIDNILSDTTALQLRQYLYELRSQSEREVLSGKVLPIQRFAHVLLKRQRCDLTIPLGNNENNNRDNNIIIKIALLESLLQSPVGSTIVSLFGKDAILHEFSCLMSDSGSQRQVFHPDTPFVTDDNNNEAVLYTCFVALQDITMDMGPTTWLPRTHTREMHDQFKDSSSGSSSSSSSTTTTTEKIDDRSDDGIIGNDSNTSMSPKDHLIQSQPAVLGLLPRGSCVLFDSRLLHCGTANRSNNSRALFYFSFKNPKVLRYSGNPASIRKELGDAKVTLGSLMDDLLLFGRGEDTPLMNRLGKLMM